MKKPAANKTPAIARDTPSMNSRSNEKPKRKALFGSAGIFKIATIAGRRPTADRIANQPKKVLGDLWAGGISCIVIGDWAQR